MHPAVGDSALHLSLVPNSALTGLISPKIPISLAVLALPGRRNGLLRAPWAAAMSRPIHAGRDVIGDMAVNEEAQASSIAGSQLHFCDLQSRAAAAGATNWPLSVAASQVWASLSAAQIRYLGFLIGSVNLSNKGCKQGLAHKLMKCMLSCRLSRHCLR